MPNRLETVEPTSLRPTDETALDLFFRIAAIWELTTEQQIKLLGSPARSTFFKWKKEGGLVSGDTDERISHIASIFKCLGILMDTPEAGDRWLKRPNRYFEDNSALDVMLEGKLADILAVRQYLDAQRGG